MDFSVPISRRRRDTLSKRNCTSVATAKITIVVSMMSGKFTDWPPKLISEVGWKGASRPRGARTVPLSRYIAASPAAPDRSCTTSMGLVRIEEVSRFSNAGVTKNAPPGRPVGSAPPETSMPTT